MIHQEAIILALEVIAHQLRCKYIEPAFYPLLEAHGWSSVERWFSTRQYNTSQPNLSRDDILI
jgi:hypothetical protein